MRRNRETNKMAYANSPPIEVLGTFELDKTQGIKLHRSNKRLKLATVRPGWNSETRTRGTEIATGSKAGALTLSSVKDLDSLIALLDGDVRVAVRAAFKAEKQSKGKAKRSKKGKQSKAPELSEEEGLVEMAKRTKLSSRADLEFFLSQPGIKAITKKGYKAGKAGGADFESLKKWARKAKDALLLEGSAT